MTYKYTNISNAVYALKTFFSVFGKIFFKLTFEQFRILRKIWCFKDSVSHDRNKLSLI